MIRKFSIVLMSLVFGGCDVMEGFTLSSGPQYYDPERIYIDGEFVSVQNYSEVRKLACINGPVFCKSFGMQWDCSCR